MEISVNVCWGITEISLVGNLGNRWEIAIIWNLMATYRILISDLPSVKTTMEITKQNVREKKIRFYKLFYI